MIPVNGIFIKLFFVELLKMYYRRGSYHIIIFAHIYICITVKLQL